MILPIILSFKGGHFWKTGRDKDGSSHDHYCLNILQRGNTFDVIFPGYRALDNASRKITQREAFSRSSISDSIERDASCCECDV